MDELEDPETEEEDKDDAEDVRMVIFAPGCIVLLEGKPLPEEAEFKSGVDGKGGG